MSVRVNEVIGVAGYVILAAYFAYPVSYKPLAHTVPAAQP